ncbi:hypothetical protein ACRRVB_03500 [Candidatus Cardinium hertigii]|uniref:hypothetical protein n=1 Tax=Candidatus Cardinium hertigii TaxID=247481 RepID=UPI003D7EA7B2
MDIKGMNLKKYMLGFFFLAYTSVAYPSKAVGLATGPSLGIAGFYTTLNLKKTSLKTSIDNIALQIGWFAQLDLWVLYAKLDGWFVLDSYKLLNKSDRNYLKYIQAPLTIGIPIFNLFRPHIGLIFRMPVGENDGEFKGNQLIEIYKEKINGYILGIGIVLGHFLIDIDFELGRSSLAKKSISPELTNGDEKYRPKQLALKIHYNLLG